MPTPPPDPVCKAILLCQKVIIEAETELVSLIGIFNGFVIDGNGKSAPAEVFCQFTEAEGKYRITVEIHDLSTGNVIAGADGGEFDIPNRLARANVIIPIPPIPFRHAGAYDFLMLANGKEIDRQHFMVVKRD
jgi:hypothetical protein